MRTKTLASLLASAGMAALIGCSTPSIAARYIDVSVIDRVTGQRLPTYRNGGKLYIAGTPGNNYSVELSSRSDERVMTVISVDGVNVLTGQTAAPLQSGYVLDSGRAYGISGWRKSMEDVAQFVFTALPDSYAARTGRPDNVGVIGVAVFRAKTPPPTPLASTSPYADRFGGTRTERRDLASNEAPAPATSALAKSATRESDAQSAGAAQSRMKEESKRLGTGHGDREYAPTQYTSFERASDTPDEIITLYYDSRKNLIARGIIREPVVATPSPNPFPGAAGFVPDPRS